MNCYFKKLKNWKPKFINKINYHLKMITNLSIWAPPFYSLKGKTIVKLKPVIFSGKISNSFKKKSKKKYLNYKFIWKIKWTNL